MAPSRVDIERRLAQVEAERRSLRSTGIKQLCELLGLKNSCTLGQVVPRARVVAATGAILSSRAELGRLFELPDSSCGASGARECQAMALASECFKA